MEATSFSPRRQLQMPALRLLPSFLPVLALLPLLLPLPQVAFASPSLPLDPFDALGPWHQRHLDCGIPPFAYRLPQDAQDKIHAIWLNYQVGEDCDEEQEQTRAVIMAIPEEVRMQLFKSACGPSFLKNESEEVRDKFREVWFNEALNVEQKRTEFQKLAQELLSSEEAKTNFQQFDKRLGVQVEERQQKMEKLSAPAREAYDKWLVMRKEERTFLASLSAEVRQELGLLCTCCGTCKTGQKVAAAPAATEQPKAPAMLMRARRAMVEADQLAKVLARAEAEPLNRAADSICNYQ